MNILLVVLALVFLNLLIGAAVLSFVDDQDERLFQWYVDCPEKLVCPTLVLSFWPVILYLVWRNSR